MAKPKTLPFKDFVIELGDNATPTEAFAAPCGLNSRGIEFTKELNDVTVPDCDDPEIAADTERAVVAKSSRISGDGILALEALPDWWEFYSSSNSRSVRVRLDAPAVDNGGHWQGKYHLSTLGVTANLGEKVSVTVEMQSDGAVAWVPAV